MLKAIPFDAPVPSVFADALHELRVDELRADEQPL
jgi:hypothetical protein